MRLNVGKLTCLDARGGTVGMHVKPLAPRLRQKLDGLGSVEGGQKSSPWFTRGALWVVVPVEDLTQVADRLLPEAHRLCRFGNALYIADVCPQS